MMIRINLSEYILDNFLGFVAGVWASIFIGVFFIAMIIGVSFDRHGRESAKWWILFFGVIGFCIWKWDDINWQTFWQRDLWVGIGIYLAIGLGYSVLEFMLEVRRSARKWSERWKMYKKHSDPKIPQETLANTFVANRKHDYELIQAERNPDPTATNLVVPRVSRAKLASFIGAWTFFWPFYAISLIIGDLVFEICRIVADVLTNISGRFVRAMFKDVFN